MPEVVVGSGGGGPGDHLGPSLDLARSGLVGYLVFDHFNKRNGADAARARLAGREDPAFGHNPRVGELAEAFAPYMANRVRVIGSFGGSNVASAIAAAVEGVRRAGVSGLRVAGIHGDDVLKTVLAHDLELPMLGCRASDLGADLLAVQVYVGGDSVADALDAGADLVIGGRIGDASLAVGAVCHQLGWSFDDWDGLALGTLVGHLLSGGVGTTGGGFADPPYRVVPGIGRIGVPMARVSSGQFVISKLPDTGGLVSPETVKCRISYEIDDPANYLTSDVTADFSMAYVEQTADDEVRVSGIQGKPKPDKLLAVASVERGWIGIGEISFAGPGCLDRARLGEEVAREHLAPVFGELDDFRVDYYGYNALHGGNYLAGEPADVRLRIAARTRNEKLAREVSRIGSRIYWGPAGGGAMSGQVRRATEFTDVFLPRDLVHLETEVVQL